MYVLGINGGHKSIEEESVLYTFHHDAAAVLLKDNIIVAAIEEERLNRSKHTNCFPVNAIRKCMTIGGIDWNDVDRIAVNGDAQHIEDLLMLYWLLDTTLPVQTDATSVISYLFHKHFGVDISSKVRFCHHHLSHAYSTYAVSGFTQALILSIDGFGDGSSGMVLHGNNSAVTELRTFSPSQSLGLLYVGIISILGFHFFDEYKAMGLAPYGDPSVYRGLFQEEYHLLPDGDYQLEPMEHWRANLKRIGVLQQARRQQERFTQTHMDVAAALQEVLEEIALHVLRYFRSKINSPHLCMAGGVAHNSTLNGRILYEGLFDEVFVQPAAHDAGGALGAAISVVMKEGTPEVCRPLCHVALGLDIGTEDDIDGQLSFWEEFVEIECVDNIATTSAELLANGAVIGWVQGRSEFGPRALGNRSILADPRPASNKERINAMVKKRESYRPFAPSVIRQRASDFFEVPTTMADLSFMTFVLRVKQNRQTELGAVTHVNGTARVQVVSREHNPLYFDLIDAFGNITGTPVLLNTSFNNNAEPIVDSVQDAMRCFLTTNLDALALGRRIIRKKGPIATCSRAKLLRPQLSAWSRLEKSTTSDGSLLAITDRQRIGGYRAPKKLPVSSTVFTVLALADGQTSVQELMNEVAGEEGDISTVLAELVQLWSERVIDLIPSRSS